MLLLAGPVYLSERDRDGTSGETRRRVDAEVARMLREAYQRVTSLLVCHCQSQIDIQLQRACLQCLASVILVGTSCFFVIDLACLLTIQTETAVK